MWILRFHLLKSKDYNKIQRICKKYGFSTRSHSPIMYAKASIKHLTQKTSWRSLSREYHIDHASLAKFHKNMMSSAAMREIFHVFLESRSCLFLGESKNFSVTTLDNSQEIYFLTKQEFEHMM